jgi:hypothetical protein
METCEDSEDWIVVSSSVDSRSIDLTCLVVAASTKQRAVYLIPAEAGLPYPLPASRNLEPDNLCSPEGNSANLAKSTSSEHFLVLLRASCLQVTTRSLLTATPTRAWVCYYVVAPRSVTRLPSAAPVVTSAFRSWASRSLKIFDRPPTPTTSPPVSGQPHRCAQTLTFNITSHPSSMSQRAEVCCRPAIEYTYAFPVLPSAPPPSLLRTPCSPPVKVANMSDNSLWKRTRSPALLVPNSNNSLTVL